MARWRSLSAPLCLAMVLALFLCAGVGPAAGSRKKPKAPVPAPADQKTEPAQKAAEPEPPAKSAAQSPVNTPPASAASKIDSRKKPAPTKAKSSDSTSTTAAATTECKPDQKPTDCVRDLYGALETRFAEYEACDNSTKQKLKQVEELRAIMETAEKEGMVGLPSAKAQIRNMIAQNSKLVAELGKYQGFSSENEKMQRTIRKTSTELDLLKSQVEVLTRKVKEEKRKLVEIEKEVRNTSEEESNAQSIARMLNP